MNAQRLSSMTTRRRKQANPIATLASLIAAAVVAVAPASAQQVEVEAAADARVQGGAPDVNYPTGDLWLGLLDKTAYLYFELPELPAGAEITSAELIMTPTGVYEGSNDIELGAVQGRWREDRVTYANQPDVAWSGLKQTVSGTGAVRWDVKKAVKAWVEGRHRNRGLALRGDGTLKSFRSREFSSASDRPRLVIDYTLPTGTGAPVLKTRARTESEPVEWLSVVPYQVRLEHNGDQTVPAKIRDRLPYPLHVLSNVDVKTSGGASGTADVEYDMPSFDQVVKWDGTMPPGSRVTLSFDVHVHPLCARGQRIEAIRNLAEARSGSLSPINAEDTFNALCPGFEPISIESEPLDAPPIDFSQVSSVRFTLRNKHSFPVTLGLLRSGAPADAPPIRRVTLGAGEQQSYSYELINVLITSIKGDNGQSEATIGFCMLFDDDEQAVCPDRSKAPHLFGELVVARS